ncbi:MAG: glycine cleavage system aminomethyltransferase GcvT [bacterium]
MSTGADPKRTPLYHAHEELGAKIVDFHGFLMPVQYSGIQDEHRTVRSKAGLFDISHMGEFEVWGDGAFDFVQYVTTNDVADLSTHQVQYSGLCYEHGGLVDDLTVYRLPDHYLLVVNASNIEKDFEWLEQHLTRDVELRNRSDEYGLLALQGPVSEEILQPLTETVLDKIGFYWSAPGTVVGERVLISRTGYTGEDGFEIYVEGGDATRRVWEALMEAGRPAGMVPVGLGARDTLRLEVAYNLYGNDIWEETTPLEARMGWVVKMGKGDFLGRDALQKQKEEGLKRRLVGLGFEGRVFPRSGYPIMEGEKEIGMVTSGTVGPSTGTPIALGYVSTDRAETGTSLTVDCRGREARATVVELPFYREGSRR